MVCLIEFLFVLAVIYVTLTILQSTTNGGFWHLNIKIYLTKRRYPVSILIQWFIIYIVVLYLCRPVPYKALANVI